MSWSPQEHLPHEIVPHFSKCSGWSCRISCPPRHLVSSAHTRHSRRKRHSRRQAMRRHRCLSRSIWSNTVGLYETYPEVSEAGTGRSRSWTGGRCTIIVDPDCVPQNDKSQHTIHIMACRVRYHHRDATARGHNKTAEIIFVQGPATQLEPLSEKFPGFASCPLQRSGQPPARANRLISSRLLDRSGLRHGFADRVRHLLSLPGPGVSKYLGKWVQDGTSTYKYLFMSHFRYLK